MTDEPDQPDQTALPESVSKNDDRSDTPAEESQDIFLERWFHILATVLMSVLILSCSAVPVLLCFVSLGVLLSGGADQVSQGFSQMALLGSFVAMFGILITGIFVFMAIRIDRGAKEEARHVANASVKRVENEAKIGVEEARNAAEKEVHDLSEKMNKVFEELKEEANRNVECRFKKLREEANNKKKGTDDNMTKGLYGGIAELVDKCIQT